MSPVRANARPRFTAPTKPKIGRVRQNGEVRRFGKHRQVLFDLGLGTRIVNDDCAAVALAHHIAFERFQAIARRFEIPVDRNDDRDRMCAWREGDQGVKLRQGVKLGPLRVVGCSSGAGSFGCVSDE